MSKKNTKLCKITGKIRFSRHGAERITFKNPKYWSYYCRFCRSWHLTSQQPGIIVRKEENK